MVGFLKLNFFCVGFASLLLSFANANTSFQALHYRELEQLCAVNSLYVAGRLLGVENYSYVNVYESYLPMNDSDWPSYSLAGVKKAARKLGYAARFRKISPRQLKELDQLVAIVFIKPEYGEKVGHFLCIRANPRGDGVQVIDPPNYPVTLTSGLSSERYMAVLLGSKFQFGMLSHYEVAGLLFLVLALILGSTIKLKRAK